MYNIDLNVVEIIYNGLIFLPSNYWQLLCSFFLLTILINSVVLYKQSEIDGKIIVFWKLNSMIYITILFITFFGTPMVSILSYMPTSKDAKRVDVSSAYTLLVHILWCAILCKLLLLPIYYNSKVTMAKKQKYSCKETY